MNEREWLRCGDPQEILDFMDGKTSHRKMELYTTGSYRLVWHLLTDQRIRTAIEVREKYFDGLAGEAEHIAAIVAAEKASKTQHDAWDAISPSRQVELARDIFGNPFRRIDLDPSLLRDSAIHELAQTIYHKRAFDRLTELAEMLEKAGCSNTEIISHCRLPGEHWRGCWVIDMLLGKA